MQVCVLLGRWFDLLADENHEGDVNMKLPVQISLRHMGRSNELESLIQNHARLRPEQPQTFAVRVRIPGWVRGQVLPGSRLYHYFDGTPADWSVKVNGRPLQAALEAGYAVLERTWRADDEIELHLPMPVRRVVANPQVVPNRGRVALERMTSFRIIPPPDST